MAKGGSNSGVGKSGNAGRGPGRSGGKGPNYRRPGGGGGGTGGNTGGTTHKSSSSATAPQVAIVFGIFLVMPSLLVAGLLGWLLHGYGVL